MSEVFQSMRLSAFPALLIASIVAVSGPARAAAQGGFEGVVTSNFYSDPNEPPTEVKTSVKGMQSRMDMNAGGMPIYTIMDMQKAQMTSVMPQQQMYFTMDLKGMAKATEGTGVTGNETDETPPPALTKTGQSETIAGHNCDHYLMGEDQDMDVCAAKGLGTFGMGNMGGGGGGPFSGAALPQGWAQYAAQFEDGFFPLKMEKVDGDKRKLIMEVTKIEPQSLSADLFTVPAEFKEMKMPGM
jgi:hypothetical protein